MDFIYFFGPLLLVILVAAVLFRNHTRARARKPMVTRSRAWRDQAGATNPFPNTTVVAENDAASYAAFAAVSSPSNDSISLPACNDTSSNYSDAGSACSDTSSTSTY